MRLLLCLCCVLGLALTANADPIQENPPGGPWYEFLWSSIGTDAIGGGGASSGGNSIHAPGNPWTFTGAYDLTVTDAFIAADHFNVYDFGALVGTTPLPAGGGSGTSDPDVAISEGTAYSWAVFSLGGGSHSITIQAAPGSLSSGAGFFKIESVPEPASLALLGLGLAGFAVRRRRRRS